MNKFKYFIIILIGIFLGIFFFICLKQPMMADDYHNLNLINQNPGLFNYLSNLYFTWTGRLQGATLLWFILSFDKSHFIYSIFNTFIFFYSIVLIFEIGFKKSFDYTKESFYKLLLLIIICWFGIPNPDETIVWITGSIVYLWGVFFALIYIRLWMFYNKKLNLLNKIMLFFFSVWTSLSSELIFGVILFFSIFNLYFDKNINKLKYYIMSVGVLIGGILLLSAPGNYVRLLRAPTKMNLIFLTTSFLKYIILILLNYWFYLILFFLIIIISYKTISKTKFSNIKLIIFNILGFMIYFKYPLLNINMKTIRLINYEERIFLLFIYLFYIYLIFNFFKEYLRNILKSPKIFLYMSGILFVPLFFLVHWRPERQTFYAVIFMIIYMVTYIKLLDFKNKKLKIYILLIFFILLADSSIELYYMNRVKQLMDKNFYFKIYNYSINEDISIKKFKFPQRRLTHIKFLNKDNKHWINKSLAEYFHFKSISLD